MIFSPGIEWKVSKHSVPYETAILSMENRVEDIHANRKPPCIWLLEHPPLYTHGTATNLQEDIRDPSVALPFPLHKAGRGGRITYHGPGQRIIYCMLDLKSLSSPPNLQEFLKTLEHWIIDVLQSLHIEAFQREDQIGVWTKGREGEPLKIASLGIRIRHWISYHGISLNIHPDLSHYAPIVPCGIQTHGITSLASLGCSASFKDIDKLLKRKCPF